MQGRFQGDERVERLKVNVSLDGQHWAEHPSTFKVDSNDSAILLTPVLTGKFVRLIPRTDQGMPICIRTELYGCYRDDKLARYTLSHPPVYTTPEVGLDHGLSGIGRLHDGDMADYLKFESDSNSMEVTLDWQEPVNITELLFHISVRSNACLSRITIIAGADSPWTYNLGCGNSIGPRILPLLIGKVVDSMHLQLEFTGTLELAEIDWSSDMSLKPIRMNALANADQETEGQSLDIPPWMILVGGILGGSLFLVILVIFIFVTRKRFRRAKSRSVASYNSASTLRDGTWFNLIPNTRDGGHFATQSNIVSNHHQIVDSGLAVAHHHQFDNRANELYAKNHFIQVPPPPFTPVSLPARCPSNNFGTFYQGQNAQRSRKNVEFGHEYSEIGSITADSGRGESVEGEKTDYAELTYA